MAIIGNVRVELLPDSLIREAVTAGPLWRAFGERIRHRAEALAPVGKEQELGANFGKPHGGDHLKDQIEVRFVMGPDPYILVGSTATVDGGLSKLGLILEGTDPHPIEPVRAQALRFTAGGTVVFTKHVDHPGTKKNEFVQRAMREICHEVGAVAV